MVKEILVVLGSPNSLSGELGVLSKERLDFCLKKYKNDTMILCTGGWGDHFNIAKEPHAFFTRNYLIEKGIPETQFLENALSGNTVEDAVKVKEIIASLENIQLSIITSEYHLERVKLIFKEIFEGYRIQFFGVKTNLEKEKLEELIRHEKKAIEGILKNGLYY